MINLAAVLIILTEVVIQSQGSRQYENSKSFIKDLRQNGFYDFHYLIDHENSHQYRKETRKNGKVTGSYGIVDPDGRKRMVYYVADEDGFRAKINTNEPGVLPVNPASIEFSKYENTLNDLMEPVQNPTSTSSPDTTMHSTSFYKDKGPYIHPLSPISKLQDGNDQIPVLYSVHIDHSKGNSWDTYSQNNINPYGYSLNPWKISKAKERQQSSNVAFK